MKTIELKQIFESHNEKNYTKSKWNKGVNEYANELLEKLAEDYEETTIKDIEEQLLNGAITWKAYSWGGNSLIYNEDIAERLATQSELKRLRRKDGSIKQPNKNEDWLDVQARALFQAYKRIQATIFKLDTK